MNNLASASLQSVGKAFIIFHRVDSLYYSLGNLNANSLCDVNVQRAKLESPGRNNDNIYELFFPPPP